MDGHVGHASLDNGRLLRVALSSRSLERRIALMESDDHGIEMPIGLLHG